MNISSLLKRNLTISLDFGEKFSKIVHMESIGTYLVKYERKNGSVVTEWVQSLGDAEKCLKYCYKRKMEARVTRKNGEIVGRVFEDVSKRSGYDWFLMIT